MENFWDNKPVNVNTSSIKEHKQILPIEQAFININNEIDQSKIKLDYKVYNELNTTIEIPYENITNFINNNYINDEIESTIYTVDIIKFYSKDCLIIEFYPKDKKTVIGYIFGRRHKISIFENITDTIEVNFLCIIPTLRSINVSTYMINIISRECVINYNIPIAHYTVNKNIKSPFFSEKKFYHRFINILKLYNIEFINTKYDILKYMEKFNKYLCDETFKNSHTIEYINNGLEYFSEKPIDSNIISELYSKLIDYNKNTYDIYECISFENYMETFKYKDFHHFIVRNKNNEIVNYFLYYKLEFYIKHYKTKYTNGYLYSMFFSNTDDIVNSMELVNHFIYNYMIFDVTTIIDIFNIDYELINSYLGSGLLRYYYFNMMISPILNHKNNLITL